MRLGVCWAGRGSGAMGGWGRVGQSDKGGRWGSGGAWQGWGGFGLSNSCWLLGRVGRDIASARGGISLEGPWNVASVHKGR